MEYQLTRVEALLAGTLALMTGHAQACCDNGRQLMTAKIVANLSLMTEHPALSLQLQVAASNLRKHWQGLQTLRVGMASWTDKTFLEGGKLYPALNSKVCPAPDQRRTAVSCQYC